MYKAVVFDMDGVIFDSERCVLQSWIDVADQYSITDIDKVFIKCIGTNEPATKKILFEHYGPDFPYDEYRKKSSAIFHAKYDDGRLPMKPGIKELLQYLTEQGYLVGLASSTKEIHVRQEITDAGLLPYFKNLTCGDMLKKSKPEPDIFLMACDNLGVKPEEAIAIEDSFNGIRAAHRAGMFPIMVPDLIAPDDEMRELAGMILSNLMEVKAWLQTNIL